MVLRPSRDGTYRLVTVTYTDDVMHGEFLKEIDRTEDTSFILR